MAVTTSSEVSPWSRHARQWSQVGSPLRPVEEDCRLYWREVGDVVEAVAAPRALVLGVTPELALLPWPRQSHLTAVDQSQDMIDRVWPRRALRCTGKAVCSTWNDMPLDDASVDVMVGDGSLSVLPSGRDYPAMIAEIHRVLRPGGQLALRCFVHPDENEPIDQVFTDLDDGRIGSMHALKWRIAMVLQKSLTDGVVVSDIRDCFMSHLRDREAAAQRLGWPIEAINTIDAYAGSMVSYTFPTLGEITAAVAGRFEVTGVAHPSYELGDRCPVIGFKRLP